ncbi:MAG: uroporphyrinogen-III synthase [Burkholderiales bacterium]
MTAPLSGIAVLITRPAQQAATLAGLIRGLGGKPLLFPAIEIEEIADREIAGVLERMEAYDLVVFVSPNAARVAMDCARRLGSTFSRSRLAAIGPGTAAELEAAGVGQILMPAEGFDSEALYRKITLALHGNRRVLLVRGEGGREWLGKTLREDGVSVEELICYRRVKPTAGMESVLPRWLRGDRIACMATSGQVVENLFEMAGLAGQPWLRRTPFFVPHARVARTAFKHGVTSIFVAGVGDPALVRGLETWYGRKQQAPSSH